MSDRRLILLSFTMALGSCALLLFALWDLRQVNEQNRLLREQAEICKTALTASQAKLEMVNDLFTTARGTDRRAIGIGGE
jgi:hypothetical protein